MYFTSVSLNIIVCVHLMIYYALNIHYKIYFKSKCHSYKRFLKGLKATPKKRTPIIRDNEMKGVNLG
jgi:hypothetical protein